MCFMSDAFNNVCTELLVSSGVVACAAAGLFVSNSGFNRLHISARYLVSNSAESHGYI